MLNSGIVYQSVKVDREGKGGRKPSATSHQPSAISHQPSAISHQPSARIAKMSA
jgi:hypothetical protein